MVVVDASVVADFVAGTATTRRRARRRLAIDQGALHCPHLLTAEVGHVIRRRVLNAEMTPTDALAALHDLDDMPLNLHPHGLLLDRAIELHANASFYDALYLALAEALDAKLLTLDARLCGVPVVGARVEVLR